MRSAGEPLVPQKRRLAVLVFPILAILALAADAVLGAYNVQRMAEAGERVSATHRVLEEVQLLLASVQEAETGQRGFLLTGEATYLEPYAKGEHEVQRHLATLVELTRDNPAQRRSV